jgi:hypothetical protein
MPPTKVEIIKPAVMEIIPALVRRVCGETPRTPRIPKLIAMIAIIKNPNCRIVDVWVPICGVNKGLARRRRSSTVNPKKRTIAILVDSLRKIGSSIGAAMNKSKM